MTDQADQRIRQRSDEATKRPTDQPTNRPLGLSGLQAQMGVEGVEVSVGGQEGVLVLNAPGGDDGVDGFAQGHAVGTKFAVVAGGLDGELGVAEGDGFEICHQLMR